MRPHESFHRLDVQDVGPEILEVPEFDFDIAKMVTEEDWQWVGEQLARLRQDNVPAFARVASKFMLLDPVRVQKYIEPGDWQRMKEQLELDRQSRNTQHWSDFADLASSMARIDPVQARGLVHEEDWAGLEAKLGDRRTMTFWDLANFLEELGTIDLERTRQLLLRDELDWIVAQLRADHHSSIRMDRWFFMRVVSIVTMFKPDIVKTEISADDWTKMIEDFLSTNRGSVMNFAATAASLVTLARVLKPLHAQNDNSTTLPEVKKY